METLCMRMLRPLRDGIRSNFSKRTDARLRKQIGNRKKRVVAILCLILASSTRDTISQINSAQSVAGYLKARCTNQMEAKCSIRVLDELWKDDPIVKTYLAQYLATSGEDFASDYLKRKFLAKKDRLLNALLLNSLISRHSADDIPFFIDLISDNSVISREGDKTSSLCLDYLQAAVLVEYDFDPKRFFSSPSYRAKIRKIYADWYLQLRNHSRLAYNKDCLCFLSTDNVPMPRVEAHWKWYKQIVKSRS